jgi:hypothetical protein
LVIGEKQLPVKPKEIEMLKKAVLTTIAAVALATSAFGSSAFAGGYGSGNNHGGYGGHNNYNGGYKHQRSYVNGRDGSWRQHVDWCYGRYNTYRDYDNSYQPHTGPRQRCFSPYYKG